MHNKLEVTFEGDHIRVVADGDKDYHFLYRTWRDVAEVCELHDCYNVLGIANTTTPVEALEGFELAALFKEFNIDQRYRIAWVESDDDAKDVAKFVETVMANRGLPGLLFETEAEAREWLLGS